MMNKICPLINQECIKEKCYACKNINIEENIVKNIESHFFQIRIGDPDTYYDPAWNKAHTDEKVEEYISWYKRTIVEKLNTSIDFKQHNFLKEDIKLMNKNQDYNGGYMFEFQYIYQIECIYWKGCKLMCTHFNTEVE